MEGKNADNFFIKNIIAIYPYVENISPSYISVGGEALENIDTSTTSIKNSQVRFNDNSKWHKVSVIKSGFETILVVDNYRSSTHHNRRDITFEGSQDDNNGKTWTKRKLNVPENIGVDKVLSLIHI